MSEGLRNFLFTSESVTEGHPDKIADQISDSVLDEVMRQDPKGRVACETLVTTGLAVVAGEITTTAHVDYDTLVRDTIRGVGYDDARYGYDANTCAVMCTVKRQSPDIAMGVDTGGAGDQGLMFGFAQSTPDRSRPADNSGPVSNDQRSGSNWGWIGLLGLAGLAGLGGRSKAAADRDNVRMRPAA